MELTEGAIRLLDSQDWFDQLPDIISELTWEGAGLHQGALILPVTVCADIMHILDYCCKLIGRSTYLISSLSLLKYL